MPKLNRTSMKLNELKSSSRVWIYQADRLLTTNEVNAVNESGAQFVANWAAHGSALEAAVEVLHNLFVVVAVDEQVANATGCSIDKSVYFVQELGKNLGVDFFNRINLAVEVAGNLELMSITKVQEGIKNGRLNEQSFCYNNTIQTLGELNSNWRVPIKVSWVAGQVLVS